MSTLYNFIKDKLPSIFKNVVLGNLESCFQLDRQVDISRYLTDPIALRHSRELASLEPL